MKKSKQNQRDLWDIEKGSSYILWESQKEKRQREAQRTYFKN